MQNPLVSNLTKLQTRGGEIISFCTPSNQFCGSQCFLVFWRRRLLQVCW